MQITNFTTSTALASPDARDVDVLEFEKNIVPKKAKTIDPVRTLRLDISKIPNLQPLFKRSQKVLRELITKEGIYASTAGGVDGVFHGYFGRDTAITGYLVWLAQTINPQKLTSDELTLGQNAIQAIINLSRWQGQTNDPDTGEEVGKIPHEIRTEKEYYDHLTTQQVARGLRSWYVDPKDQILKNWDSNDSTPFWIITLGKFWETGDIEFDEELLKKYRLAIDWCLKNLDDFGGLSAFTYNPDRQWSGLSNQGWKDSSGAYLDATLCEIPKHPIYDVWVNGLMWCALKYGAKVLAAEDKTYADFLLDRAQELKARFNSVDRGFLMREESSQFYYAEALDGDGKQLNGVSCDPALVLWSSVDGECAIEEQYIPHVVKRILAQDMFDGMAGIRTYSSDGRCYDPLEYHRGPNTFWPFISALTALGLSNFGYQTEAEQILQGMLWGVTQFQTNIEVFLKKDGRYLKYINPDGHQHSSKDQAWTAASIYLCQKLSQQKA